jgi:hypothetical protein
VKLSFGDVLSESFSFFFANLRLFFHLVTIPWIISVAIRIVGAVLAHDSLFAILLEKAVDVVPTVMFMVAWQRVVLLGPNRVDRLPGLGWSPRESAYLVHLIKVFGITFLLVGAFIFTVGSLDPSALGAGMPLDPESGRRQAIATPLGAGFMVSVLLALRVSWGLAATAVDVPFSPRLSWACSRGNAWTIIGVLFLTFVAGAIATTVATLAVLGLTRGALGAQEAAAVVTWTAAILVSYAGTCAAATVQAVIFRRLLAWREGALLPTLSPS